MKELGDVPETRADQDFADGSIFWDQLRSIANHITDVARPELSRSTYLQNHRLNAWQNNCNYSVITADCSGLFNNNRSRSGTNYMAIQQNPTDSLDKFRRLPSAQIRRERLRGTRSKCSEQ